MFEDSTFESTGRIQTRSRGWMVATFFLNGTILFGLVLIPLIHPEALSPQAFSFLLTTPPPPPSRPPLPKQQQPQHAVRVEMMFDAGSVQRLGTIRRSSGPEQVPGDSLISLGPGEAMPGTGASVFNGGGGPVVVHPEITRPVRLSSTLVAGLLIYKVTPQYPAIAREARIGGTVALQATISKNGAIENLRVVSGPAMLQQAAIDAVKMWRYRPYMLNNVPVEVETTVNVVFSLGG